jgi:hypothetical protein
VGLFLWPPKISDNIGRRMKFGFRMLFAVALCGLAYADDWVRLRSGPFEILSNSGERDAREQAYEAEQLRYAFGYLLGKQDPGSTFPIRIVVLKDRQAAQYAVPGGLAMSRDAWISVAAGAKDLGPEWRGACARVFLEANTGRLPAEIERGLVAFLSTLEIKGPKLSWGAPPDPAGRTRDWARIAFLATNPDYSSRVRVFLSNLENGADYDSAYRNAFEKSAAEINRQIDAYLAANKFERAPLSGRALSPRDFTMRAAEAYDGRVALADLLLANPGRAPEAEAAYRALTGAEAQEGLGFLALRAGRADAKAYFESAAKAGSKNPRAWVEMGTREALDKAVELNPQWAEPHIRLAALESDPGRKATELKRAAALEPRNPNLWKALALAATDANQFGEAAKAWAAAERAAASPAEREQIRLTRLDLERKKADYEAAERQRLADEQAREIQRLKDQALADIRAAEEKARKEMNAGRGPAPAKVEQWWDAGPTQKVSGMLQRIECMGRRARLVIAGENGSTIQLLVADPGKIALSGAGELKIACGVQKPMRKVTVEYTPAPDSKLKTAGNVQVIEYQ